jgi:hypothetical protein
MDAGPGAAQGTGLGSAYLRLSASLSIPLPGRGTRPAEGPKHNLSGRGCSPRPPGPTPRAALIDGRPRARAGPIVSKVDRRERGTRACIGRQGCTPPRPGPAPVRAAEAGFDTRAPACAGAKGIVSVGGRRWAGQKLRGWAPNSFDGRTRTLDEPRQGGRPFSGLLPLTLGLRQALPRKSGRLHVSARLRFREARRPVGARREVASRRCPGHGRRSSETG